MRILLEFARAQPLHSLLLLLCLIVAASAEALAITSLLPLFAALDAAASGGAATGGSTKLETWFRSGVESLGFEPSLPVLLVLVPVVFFLRAGLLILARREVGYAVARAVRDLRLRLIKALLESRWSYFVAHRIGIFSNAYGVETTRATRAYFNATWVVSLCLQLLVYLAISVMISWRITLAAVFVGAVVLLVLRPLVRLGRRAGLRQTHLSKDVIGTLTDVFQGVKALKAMAREERVGPLLDTGTRRLEKATRKQVLSREAVAALQLPISIVMLCIGCYAMVSMGYEISSMLVMAVTINQTLDALNRAQRRYQRVAEQDSAYWSLVDTIVEAEAHREEVTGDVAPTLERGIEFRSVSFGYGGEKIFDGLDLEIPAGEITALVGPSGAGKTTVVDLAVGLVLPESGEVRIDGHPIGNLDLSQWRRHIGYVPQEMFLLHDTIARNVSLGDPDVTPAQIVEALKAAQAWEFVSRMPQGVDSTVGERGSAISGGQRQRIAIARALLHHPWLLILDEATAALDPESEQAIWNGVAGLRGRMTILAISHQDTLRRVADRVYRLEHGAAKLEPAPARAADPHRSVSHGAA